jgi:uncharacterized protein
MESVSGRPTPRVSPESAPFWDGCKKGQLLLQTCSHCGRINWFPRAFCYHCTSAEFAWVPAAGTGTLESFSIVYRAMDESWASEVPYTLALVMLDEGIRLTTRLIHAAERKPTIDAPVIVRFVEIDGGFVLPYFQELASAAEASGSG